MNPTLVRHQILDNDWHPLPVAGKVPAPEGWEQFCRNAPTVAQVDAWEREFRYANNTGIALGRQVAIDIDVLSDPKLAQQLRAEAVAVFGPTPFVRIGRAPKLALIYAASGIVTTRHFKAASGNGDGVDILSEGTQCVVFGRHPETGRDYEWTGGTSPLHATPDEAPAVTEEQVNEFLDRVHKWMPLAGSTKGKRPAGTGGTQTIVRDQSGLVVDGREKFLAACIWRAAGFLDAAGEPLTVEAIASLGWAYFIDRSSGADLRDGKWTERRALKKAHSTHQRIKSGKVNLHKPAPSGSPTYSDHAEPVHEARQAVDEAIQQHFKAADSADPENPPVHAIRVATGVGKTRRTAKRVAERRKARGKGRPYVYAVPTHRLGDEIEQQFRDHGISARVFRGRSAPNPDRPGQAMCADIEAVQVALDLGLTVSTACCSGKHPSTGETVKCAFFNSCSYQAQLAATPDVWIVAHQLLFQAQAALGKVDGVIIDEGFWQAGLWTSKRGLTLDEIEASLPFGPARLDEEVNDLGTFRSKLAAALRRQTALGGVERQHLVDEGLTEDDCTKAIALEWRLKEPAKIYPGMPPAERRKSAKAAKGAKHIRSFDRIWRATRELLRQDKPADTVSGRLFLAEVESEDGKVRVARTKGARSIAKQWQAPTLIMDATLPAPEILTVFYPGVEVLADIDAAMPHVAVRQVLDAPVSANKLTRGDASRNLKAVRRAILRRFLELGRAPTLVIAQKTVAEWLRASELPAGIAVEWFNNVAGLDKYRDVRLLIAVGRTLPNVLDVESMAGALTGLEPVKTKTPAKGPRWFDRVTRGIRLKDGTGVAVEGDQHPDATAEAIRWQVCEGELVQAIGRARGVNRTASTPLDIYIVADVVLPVTVDQVVEWKNAQAGDEVEMLAAGAWLNSPSDMAKCWPQVWATAEAARDCLKARAKTTGGGNPIENDLKACVRYQLPGERQKWRTARFDLDVVPDPEAWLTERLDPLAGFDLTPPEITSLDRLFDEAATERACSEPERKPNAKQTRIVCHEVSPAEQPLQCRHHGWTRRHGLRVGP